MSSRLQLSVALPLLAFALLVAAPAAQAIPATTAPAAAPIRLGVFFWHDSPNDVQTFAGIRDGLQRAGVACEFVEVSAENDVQKGTQALAQLQRADCRLLFAMGTQATLLAMRAEVRVPIVYAAVANPVASGLVDGWRGSGKEIAGASYWIPPATVLRVFRLAVPGLAHLGILRSLPSGVVSKAELAAMREHLAEPTAPALAITEAVASDADDLPRAVAALRSAGAQAIWIPNDLVVYKNVDRVRQALGDARVPLVTTSLVVARSDAVVGATVDFALHGQRTAALALQILRGAAPGTLPVDTMQSFRVVANLDAARRCRWELPLSLLALADELVDAQAPHAQPR